MKNFLRNNGLSLALFGLFFLCLLFQSIAGLSKYNEDQKEHGHATVSYAKYLTTGDFIEATAENWESEFLSLFAMVFCSIWLREKGSTQSKPVHAPHDQTGE